MHSFILTIISIGLFSSYLLATVDYINPTARIKGEVRDRITESLHDVELGFDKYIAIHNAEPSTMADLAPAYMFIPSTIVSEGSWSFGSGVSSGRYVCLTGNFNAIQLSAAQAAQFIHSPQAFFIHSSCGVIDNSIPSPGNQVAITYWLSSYAL